MKSEIEVLHVDDEKSMAELTSDLLEQHDDVFNIETTYSPETALEMFRSEEYDCIVSDYNMPIMNGIELLIEVRKHNEDIPFILFTGKGTEEVASEAISENVTDYMQKGTGTDQYEVLAKRVKNAVKQYRSLRELDYHTSLLESVFETTLDGVVVTDINGNILKYNDRFTDILDLPDSLQIKDKILIDLFNERAASPSVIEKNIRSQYKNLDSEYRNEIILENGRILDGFSTPIKDSSQNTKGLVWFYRDITDFKELEDSRREAFDRMTDAVYAVDENWEVSLMNEKAKEVLEIERQEVKGENIWDLFEKEEHIELYEKLKETMDYGEPTSFTAYCKNVESTFEVRSYPSNSGLTVYLKEEREGKSKQQLESIVKELRNLYSITSDQDTCFDDKRQELLKHGSQYFGFETAFIGEVDGTDLVIEDSFSEHDNIKKGSRFPLKNTYCKETLDADSNLLVIKDGSNYWSLDDEKESPYEKFGLETYIGAKIQIRGEIYGTLCFSTKDKIESDITESDKAIVEVMARWISYEMEQKQNTEKLKLANKRLNNFAEIVSHDLRNPLTVAKGRLEIEQDENDSEHLKSVESALNRIESIIDEVLSVSRGFDIDNIEYLNLQNVVQESWENVNNSGIELELDVPNNVRIKSDEGRLKQLFENLFRNVREHGGDTVIVSLTENGFSVQDNGPGIKTEDLNEMFEYGYTTNENGTGLGLYIVQRIVDDHEWRILVQSKDGARFEITNVDLKR